MAKSYRTKFLVSLIAGCFLGVATLAQAQPLPSGEPVQKCITKYNKSRRQYETQCHQENTVNFNAAFQTPEFKEYQKRLQGELESMTPEQKERLRCMGYTGGECEKYYRGGGQPWPPPAVGVTRGYLGVNIFSVTPELAKAMKLDVRQGALVLEVTSGGPAAKTGIRRGDVIVGLNDEPIKDKDDLPAAVAKTSVGAHVTVTLRRNGKTQKVPVTIGERPTEYATGEESSRAAPNGWGLGVVDVTPGFALANNAMEVAEAMVILVESDSPAARAGLELGDFIREVNRQAVQSVQEIIDAIAKADNQNAVALMVKRNERSVFVTMTK